jgi:hypothetical protein
METGKKSIEKLLVSLEDYGKTGMELLTLKFVEKTSEILSKLISCSILIITFSFFLMLFSVGMAFWIGDLLQAEFYGFLVVAGIYGLAGLVFILSLPKVLTKINNSIISQMMN